MFSFLKNLFTTYNKFQVKILSAKIVKDSIDYEYLMNILDELSKKERYRATSLRIKRQIIEERDFQFNKRIEKVFKSLEKKSKDL